MHNHWLSDTPPKLLWFFFFFYGISKWHWAEPEMADIYTDYCQNNESFRKYSNFFSCSNFEVNVIFTVYLTEHFPVVHPVLSVIWMVLDGRWKKKQYDVTYCRFSCIEYTVATNKLQLVCAYLFKCLKPVWYNFTFKLWYQNKQVFVCVIIADVIENVFW